LKRFRKRTAVFVPKASLRMFSPRAIHGTSYVPMSKKPFVPFTLINQHQSASDFIWFETNLFRHFEGLDFYSTASICTSPSSPVAASHRPSGDHATQVTPLGIFAPLISICRWVGDQTATLPSRAPEASQSPSG
jgi:hypothetical protein